MMFLSINCVQYVHPSSVVQWNWWTICIESMFHSLTHTDLSFCTSTKSEYVNMVGALACTSWHIIIILLKCQVLTHFERAGVEIALGSIAPSKFKLEINWTGSTARTRSVSRSSYLRCTTNFWTGSAEPEFKPCLRSIAHAAGFAARRCLRSIVGFIHASQ